MGQVVQPNSILCSVIAHSCPSGAHTAFCVGQPAGGQSYQNTGISSGKLGDHSSYTSHLAGQIWGKMGHSGLKMRDRIQQKLLLTDLPFLSSIRAWLFSPSCPVTSPAFSTDKPPLASAYLPWCHLEYMAVESHLHPCSCLAAWHHILYAVRSSIFVPSQGLVH